MAVQKSKKSRSKRGSRRSHLHLSYPVLFFNKVNNKYNLYHHVNDDYLLNIKKRNK